MSQTNFQFLLREFPSFMSIPLHAVSVKQYMTTFSSLIDFRLPTPPLRIPRFKSSMNGMALRHDFHHILILMTRLVHLSARSGSSPEEVSVCDPSRVETKPLGRKWLSLFDLDPWTRYSDLNIGHFPQSRHKKYVFFLFWPLPS